MFQKFSQYVLYSTLERENTIVYQGITDVSHRIKLYMDTAFNLIYSPSWKKTCIKIEINSFYIIVKTQKTFILNFNQ